MSSESRATLFLGCSVALIAAAIVIGSSGSAVAPEPTRGLVNRSIPPSPSVSRVRAAVDADARRFLGSFLRYEVGGLDPNVIRTLRSTATRTFAAELLRDPPRRTRGALLAKANLGPLSLVFVSSDPPLVSVSATAQRPSGPEQLSFVFALHHRRWLASAPGE